jgi:hypothetical protein
MQTAITRPGPTSNLLRAEFGHSYSVPKGAGEGVQTQILAQGQPVISMTPTVGKTLQEIIRILQSYNIEPRGSLIRVSDLTEEQIISVNNHIGIAGGVKPLTPSQIGLMVEKDKLFNTAMTKLLFGYCFSIHVQEAEGQLRFEKQD